MNTQKVARATALITIGLAGLALFWPIHSPQLQAQQGARFVSSYQFPLFSALGRVHVRLNCPSDPGVSDATRVRLFFDILQPIEPNPQSAKEPGLTDNPAGQCTRYALVNRQDCETEIKGGEAASFAVSLINLQNGDYLIRAGIIVIGSNGKRGVIRNPIASLELTQENGAREILAPFIAGPQPDPPAAQ